MIQINAKLNRNAFISGEIVQVDVSFKNCNQILQQSLAWSCVQLHCEENATTKAMSDEKKQHKFLTAVIKSKHAIYSSEPSILFCDIILEPDKTRDFKTFHKIPLHYPPSFKGRFLCYGWYITVAAQHVDAPIKMVQLPLKVLNIDVDVEQKQSSVVNPFLNRDSSSPSVIEIATSRVDDICSVRKKRIYEINSANSVLAKVTIFKNVFKVGDNVVGKLEFPQENVRCLQILVKAETIETNLLDDNKIENFNVHSSEHMITAFVKETYFKVPLNMNAVPSFTTESIKLRWQIHFEFVSTTQELMRNEEGGGMTKLADDLNIETFKWNLPINVLACNPFNISSFFPNQSTSFLI